MQRRVFIILLPLILLTACVSGGRNTPTAQIATNTAAPITSPTPAKPLVILELPANMAQVESDQYQTLVYDLAQAAGMRYQVRNSLSPADLEFEGSALKVVITLPPDPGLASLTVAAPGVQFLAIGISGLAPETNLSTIGASGLPVDQQAFLAGYIAGLVAPEWRTGVLYQKDTVGGDSAHTAFDNGYTFYCGDCFNPNFAQPFSHGFYPIQVGIPSDAPVGNYNGYADLLIRNLVKVAYVYPAISTAALLSYLAQNNVLLVGQTLTGEDIRPNWIASIQPDLISSLRKIFPDLLAGHGGQIVPTPLLLADVNPSLLSDAKLRLVQQVLDGLQNGTIGTGVTP